MANFVTNRGATQIMNQGIDLVGGAGIKAMLLDQVNQAAYAEDRDDDFVDEGGASDPVDAEYVGTGYTGAFGGAGRKALASKTITEDDANDRAEFDAADLTWTGLGSGSESVTACLIIDETGAGADTAVDVIAHLDNFAPVTTNGGDFTLQWDAQGILQLSTV